MRRLSVTVRETNREPTNRMMPKDHRHHWIPSVMSNHCALGRRENESHLSRRRQQRRAFPRFKFCCCCLAWLLLAGVGVVAAVVAIVASKSSQTSTTVPMSFVASLSVTQSTAPASTTPISTSTSSVTTLSTITTSTTSATTTTSLFLRSGLSNWLINGDGETGPCESGSGITNPAGWEYNGTITQIFYNNTNGDLLYTDPGPSDRGRCYFYGQISAVTSMWQTVNMTSSVDALLIDNQTVSFNFSAWIGGLLSQDDNARVSLTFIDQLNQAVGSTITLGPVLAAARGSISLLLFQQVNGMVPVGARLFRVMATITRQQGSYNDGDIDNIALTFLR